MLKCDEASNPNSCWNKAKDDEMIFVLLGRDVASPAAILAWIHERIRHHKNKPEDEQIMEASKCAFKMMEKGGKP